jgi:hypothetical protein
VRTRRAPSERPYQTDRITEVLSNSASTSFPLTFLATPILYLGRRCAEWRTKNPFCRSGATPRPLAQAVASRSDLEGSANSVWETTSRVR